jgi:isobutyryl-CoA mutase
MLDYADLIAINKFDKRGAQDALRDVKKQYKRNHQLWDTAEEEMPVYGTIASQFNDPGTNRLYTAVMHTIAPKPGPTWNPIWPPAMRCRRKSTSSHPRVRYLSEIAETIRGYGSWADEQARLADRLYGLREAITAVQSANRPDSDKGGRARSPLRPTQPGLRPAQSTNFRRLGGQKGAIRWPRNTSTRCAGGISACPPAPNRSPITKCRKSFCPATRLGRHFALEFARKRARRVSLHGRACSPSSGQNEDPTRMFAGEGGPERTNKRFHYVSLGLPAKRLSTAFDSVTLYGEDPAYRPDIYGKVGNSGVSVPALDDAKKLYSGFNLCDPATSVSMTINGPAPTMLAFF